MKHGFTKFCFGLYNKTTDMVRTHPNNGRQMMVQTSAGEEATWKEEIGRPRVRWTKGIQYAMPEREVEAEQWVNRQEWRLGNGRSQ